MKETERISQVRAYVRKQLSNERFVHTQNVAQLAGELARIHGEIEEYAIVAAYLHDCTKEKTFDYQLKLLKKYNIILGYDPGEMRKCLHADTGALVARYNFDMPQCVCDAIKYHTLGSENMSKLDKILYIADKCEIGRDAEMEDAPRWREIAGVDLNLACIEILNNSIEHLKKRGKTPHRATLAVLERLKLQTGY